MFVLVRSKSLFCVGCPILLVLVSQEVSCLECLLWGFAWFHNFFFVFCFFRIPGAFFGAVPSLFLHSHKAQSSLFPPMVCGKGGLGSL